MFSFHTPSYNVSKPSQPDIFILMFSFHMPSYNVSKPSQPDIFILMFSFHMPSYGVFIPSQSIFSYPLCNVYHFTSDLSIPCRPCSITSSSHAQNLLPAFSSLLFTCPNYRCLPSLSIIIFALQIRT